MGHTASLCFNPNLKSEIAAPRINLGVGSKMFTRLVGAAAENQWKKAEGK